ncbi:MAG: hypothetical protein FWJ65_12580, partial [Limnochordales bacterium]
MHSRILQVARLSDKEFTEFARLYAASSTLGVTRNSTSSLFERVQDALADNLCHGVDVVPGDRFLAGYNPDGQ